MNVVKKVFFAKKPEFELVSPNSLKCPVTQDISASRL
jgi:hypothetical protein